MTIKIVIFLFLSLFCFTYLKILLYNNKNIANISLNKNFDFCFSDISYYIKSDI